MAQNCQYIYLPKSCIFVSMAMIWGLLVCIGQRKSRTVMLNFELEL